jgi:alpha-N-acetylgalactosaminidase
MPAIQNGRTGWLGMCLLLIIVTSVVSLDNGLARTPPMGWLQWARFTCEVDCSTYPDSCVNDKLFREMAHILKNEYQPLGYEYINIDDCWSEKFRDPTTHQLVPNAKRFPSGIKSLADHVHSLGLKLGIYGDIGKKTCQLYPGFQDENNSKTFYFAQDAKTFAEWKIDFLKVDGCYGNISNYDELYPELGDQLNKTGEYKTINELWL